MRILPQLIPCNTAGTLDRLFRIRCLTSPDRMAYRYFDRETKTWPEVTWKEMADLTSRWQQGLQQENLEKGDRVAIQLKNSIEWIAFEQAALGLGLVIVPLYVDDRPDNVAYILQDAGVKVLLVNDDKQWQDLSVHIDEDSQLKRVVLLDNSNDDSDPILSTVENWLPAEPVHLQERGGDPHKLATIVYTSGTTGRPKGVMLSHKNILFDSESLLKTIGIDNPHSLEFLSFLPLSHMYERTVGYYVPMMAGAKVSYARSVQTLAEDFQTIKPTIIATVPRIFERFYDKMQQKLSRQSIVARSMFRFAVYVGWKNFNFKQKTAWFNPIIIFNPVLNKIIGKKVQQLLGGRLQIAASGGAALPETVAKTFVGLGINIFQGYGMTESSPAVTMNNFSLNIPSSVGEIMPASKLEAGMTNFTFKNKFKDFSPKEQDQWGNWYYTDGVRVQVHSGVVDLPVTSYDQLNRLMMMIGGQKVVINSSDSIHNEMPDSRDVFSATMMIGRFTTFELSTNTKSKQIGDFATYNFTVEELV